MPLWSYYMFLKLTLWLVSDPKHGLDERRGGISE